MSITWLTKPIFRNAGRWDAIVGTDRRGTWYLRLNEPILATSERGSMLLLPAMQDGYGGTLDVVRSRITTALEASGLPPHFESTFPYHAPALFAFASMPRWACWAVRWLAELELSEPQAYDMFVACCSTEIEQNVRHLALRRVYMWEREHGYCFIRPRAKE